MLKISRGWIFLIFAQLLYGNANAKAQVPPSDTVYYSRDYVTARARFHAAAVQISSFWPKAQTRSYNVPGQVDQDLTVDYLYLPAQTKNERLIVITSGVHGIEGFTGSAIQLMIFKEFAQNFEHDKTGYLFVHAVNPYGFKYHRRATENNVNLNRNFSVSQDMYLSKNDSYMKISSNLEPHGPVASPIARFIETSYGLGSKILTGSLSLDGLTKSIGLGQYESPAGLEYGGRENEPQTRDLIFYLHTLSAAYRNIVLLDLHTGLGESYQLHVMPGDAEGSVDPTLFARLFQANEDRNIYKYTPNTSEGFYPTSGDITNILPQIKTPEQRAVSITMEFGTIGNGFVPKLETVNRLILENEGFHYGYLNAFVAREVHSSFDDLFFPQDDFWRNNVIAKARATFSRVFARMNQAGTFD